MQPSNTHTLTTNHSPAPFPNTPNLTQFYPQTHVHYSSPSANLPHELLPHIVFWVDDHPENNEKLQREILSQFNTSKHSQKSSLTILTFKSTKHALRRMTHMQNVFAEAHVRLVTDMARYEDDDNGVSQLVPDAGEVLIGSLLRTSFYRSSSCLWIKVYNAKTTRDEIEAYLRFWPWYLSLGWDFWRFAQSGFLNMQNLSYYEYDVRNWNSNVQELDSPLDSHQDENTTPLLTPKKRKMCNKFEVHLIESIMQGVRQKLDHTKDVCDFSLERIKFVYNANLWKAHRALYKQYWRDLRDELEQEAKEQNRNLTEEELFRVPKRLIAFHGTSKKNFASIFSEGFDLKRAGELDSGWHGRGAYAATYPQYAAHYIDYNGTDASSKGFKFPVEVGGELELIAGFCIPGKKAKVSGFDCYGKSAPKENSQAHFVRVAFKKQYGAENFFPIDEEQGETEHADEIVLFHNSQFLPCFLMTMRRTK